ncbi:possible trypsin protease [Vibrio variabilis]|uniref:Possible trypsin protease n=1 Tax=Vibrio variabilis TaxID=990271 RepID=A0ABQ0JG35_9VIBR|nr:possible trypsin protease [Vibrio variabilis]
MKKAFIPLLFTLVSANSFAIQDGTPINWNDKNDLVTFNCTGTIIAGKYVFTAAHCQEDQFIQFSDNTWQAAVSRTDHPEYANNSGYDVSFLYLENIAKTSSIHFFSNLANNNINDKDLLLMNGFGGTTSLNQAQFEIDGNYTYPGQSMLMKGLFIGKGTSTRGDSGAPYLNTSNEIFSLHKSGTPNYVIGTNLHYAKDFILDTINGWHYPTVANTTSGQVTIKVQSLHQSPVVDSAYTSGDAQIIGGTCQSAGPLNAFATCDYIIESQGGEGTLHLSGTESITINPQTNSGGNNGNESSGGGGSFGLASGLVLLGLGYRRRLKKG